MRALLDVNVLIALLDSDHSSHGPAMSWFAKHAREGWASCPITQNGCVRIMSNPGYPNPLPVQAVMEHLADACQQDIHEFWPDEVSLLDPDVVDSTRIHGPRQLTDVYLLALSVRHKGRFVTFDTTVPLAAVRNATTQNVLVL
ncbi:MAG: TA system VapC family ribonuclease toxin [Steroidobacteraceae bacterium]